MASAGASAAVAANRSERFRVAEEGYEDEEGARCRAVSLDAERRKADVCRTEVESNIPRTMAVWVIRFIIRSSSTNGVPAV